MLISHNIPVIPGVHSHSKPFMRSMHVALLKHELGLQSSILISQVAPVKPDACGQLHRKLP